MPIYHPLAGALVSHSQYLASADLFQSGTLSISPVDPAGKIRDFVDVGYGKPLSIMMRWLYTGRYPQTSFFSTTKPMLVSSGIRDIAATSGTTPAVNILKKSVPPQSAFTGPAAQEEGTQLLYYSPAIATPFLSLSVSLMFEDFPQELFDAVSRLFGNLASVPIFGSTSGYLLGASSAIKLASSLGKALFNGRPVMNEQMQLDFGFGGGRVPTPGYWIISQNPLGSGFHFDVGNGLVDENGAIYSGDEPVVVVSLDGAAQGHLANFQPLLASASILNQFFSQQDGTEASLDTMLNAVKLYSDLSYRKKAEDAREQMSKLQPSDPDYTKLAAELKAFNQNIGETRLQLPAAP